MSIVVSSGTLPTSIDPPPGGAETPTDRDGNGKYKDVNGNGRIDIAGVAWLFNHL